MNTKRHTEPNIGIDFGVTHVYCLRVAAAGPNSGRQRLKTVADTHTRSEPAENGILILFSIKNKQVQRLIDFMLW